MPQCTAARPLFDRSLQVVESMWAIVELSPWCCWSLWSRFFELHHSENMKPQSGKPEVKPEQEQSTDRGEPTRAREGYRKAAIQPKSHCCMQQSLMQSTWWFQQGGSETRWHEMINLTGNAGHVLWSFGAATSRRDCKMFSSCAFLSRLVHPPRQWSSLRFSQDSDCANLVELAAAARERQVALSFSLKPRRSFH